MVGFRAVSHPSEHLTDLLAFASLSVGPSVLSVWVYGWLTRTGRTEPGWIDRSGRLVGLGWLVLMVVIVIEIVT